MKSSMKFIYIVLLLSMALLYNKTYSQLPLSDPTFTLQFQDDFDSLKTSKWHSTYNWGPVNNGLEFNSPSNLLFNYNPGYLAIKCETVSPITYTPGPRSPYNYKSGAIHSKFQYKFGYFEISAIMPKGAGYWPAFWLFGGGLPGIGSCYNIGYWNEIDILENNGSTSKSNEIGGGYVWMDPDTCLYSNKACGKGVPFQNLPVPGNIAQEHKYAAFWEPNRITFYFDDIPIVTNFDTVFTPKNAINTIINFAVDPWWLVTGSTTLPNYFQINYLKIWQLQTDCNTVETFCNTAFNAGTYVSKVKKSISIGGSGCSNPSTIYTSSNIALWATDYLLFDEGTTINADGLGSFLAQVTKCPN